MSLLYERSEAGCMPEAAHVEKEDKGLVHGHVVRVRENGSVFWEKELAFRVSSTCKSAGKRG